MMTAGWAGSPSVSVVRAPLALHILYTSPQRACDGRWGQRERGAAACKPSGQRRASQHEWSLDSVDDGSIAVGAFRGLKRPNGNAQKRLSSRIAAATNWGY